MQAGGALDFRQGQVRRYFPRRACLNEPQQFAGCTLLRVEKRGQINCVPIQYQVVVSQHFLQRSLYGGFFGIQQGHSLLDELLSLGIGMALIGQLVQGVHQPRPAADIAFLLKAQLCLPLCAAGRSPDHFLSHCFPSIFTGCLSRSFSSARLAPVPKPHVPNQVPGDAPDAFEVLSNPDQGRFVQFLHERHLHGLLRLAGLFHCQFIGLLLDLVHDSVLMPGILVLDRVAEDCHGIRQIQQHLGLLVLQRFVLHRQHCTPSSAGYLPAPDIPTLFPGSSKAGESAVPWYSSAAPGAACRTAARLS